MGIGKRMAFVSGIICLGALLFWLGKGSFGQSPHRIVATGTVEATTVNLQSKQFGTVELFTVREGQTVEKGHLVARMGRSDLQAQRERDRLAVLKAEATFHDLVSGARQEEIKGAEANYQIAGTNARRANDDYERACSLYEGQAISLVELEKAQATKENTAQQLLAAEAQLNLLQAGGRPEAIEAARVEVERNKAILKATDIMLADLEIFAPIGGVIQTKNFTEGEFISAGVVLTTLVDLNDLWIKVFIPTDDLPKIKLGQKVQYSVSGVGKTFTGVVEQIASRGEFTPKTIQTKKERTNVVFAVKIRIGPENGVVKPGMPADVVFSEG